MTTAIVLAGGLGTRLRSVVSDVPKPMASIDGKPFLDLLLSYWVGQNITRFIISVGYKKESILDYFGDSFCGVEIKYVIEDAPLGTGGALLLASQTLEETFVLLNGDTFFTARLDGMIDFHRKKQAECTLSLFLANEDRRYGAVTLGPDEEVNSFDAEKSAIGSLANGGVYLINPELLQGKGFIVGQNYSIEEDIFPELIDQGARLYGLEQSGIFLDIGLPQDYLKAQDILVQRS
jgi:D-glycero-alpha-D-manno-heptose 1-phosphate guanylyltransferase